MILALFVFVLLDAGAAAGRQAAPAPAVESADLQTLYAAGQTFSQFLDSTRRRRDAWRRNYAEARTEPAALARAAAISGRWRLLVVTVDACSDSVSTIPYIAKLDEAVDAIELRIIDSQAGRRVMEAHPTPDRRAATPTIVLLDAEGNEVGCWVERPSPLQAWVLGEGAKLPDDEFYARKMDWYDADHGRETVKDIVAMIEAAAAGRPACPHRADPDRD
jgi:hypothetical protein